MRGTGWALLSTIAIGGCGFQLTTGGATGDAGDLDAGADAARPDAPPPDSAPPERKLFAASNTTLYALDVDAKTATVVGTIAMGITTFDVGGLAFDGTNLLGLSNDGAELLTIDPNTAAVTARRAISPASTYYGLTVAPAGDAGPTAVVFAGVMGGKLARIDPATAAATAIGPYTGGMQFFTDLAWVHGAGLYMTMQGGPCNTRCFARIDPETGAATPIRTNLTANVYGLSGYRGMLWALYNSGPVMRVSTSDGAMTDLGFDPGIAWTEAAQ